VVDVAFNLINSENQSVNVTDLFFSSFDLDSGKAVREHVDFETEFEDYYVSNGTHLEHTSTSGGGHTWQSTTRGGGKNNPLSGLNLSTSQMALTVTTRFRNQSTIKLAVGAFSGDGGKCNSNQGRNFMFGFESNLLCTAKKNMTDATDAWNVAQCMDGCYSGICQPLCSEKCEGSCRCYEDPANLGSPSASGDPHMTNVLGEHFNLGRVGEVELLKVPRGAMASEMNFSMHAFVEDFGETVQRCLEAPYMTSLTFRGKWFGDRPVFADMRDGNLVAFVGDQELQRQRNPLVVGRISDSKNVSIHMPNEGHVVIRIGGARIDVVRDVRPVHFFLNMQARSLSELGDSIGGILGQDDHSNYAKKPDCDKNSVIALRANGIGPMGSSASASLDF